MKQEVRLLAKLPTLVIFHKRQIYKYVSNYVQASI